jgi:hypothetical protein
MLKAPHDPKECGLTPFEPPMAKSERSNLPPGMSPLARDEVAPGKPSWPSPAQRRLAVAAAKRTENPVSRKTRVPYSESVAKRLCKHLIAGKSLRSFCAKEGNPNKSSILRWLRENPGFREIQRHDLMDEILHIADTDPDPKRARIRIEARKWRVEKLAPKKYGKWE